MRLVLFPIALLLCVFAVRGYEDTTLEDDDFAEFEQFDAEDDTPVDAFSEEEKPPPKAKPPPYKEQFEAPVEIEDDILAEDDEDSDEFEHFQDPEEFEGFQDSPPRSNEQPKIIISKVPIMVRPRWDAYWLEGMLCCVLAAYALAYAVGRAKNTAIAANFLKLHKPLLDDNFTLVGESGADVSVSPEERGWRREAENCFTMWCSGRLCCEGMLLTLKLIKRQDLVHVIMGTVRPSTDTLLVRVELGKDDGDPFVLCVAQKKHATRLAKEMQDLSVFCGERRAGDKHGLPASLNVLSECAEATGGVLDARTCAALHAHAQHLHYIHISDRYCGPKQMEEQAVTKPPETEKVMLVSVALGPDGGGEEVRPLLQLVFHLLDKIKRLRLSKEALAKCEKRRQKVAEAWLRGAHAARQEQAAARREEKRKQEKERILAIQLDFEKKHPKRTNNFHIVWNDFIGKVKNIKQSNVKEEVYMLIEYIDGISDDDLKLPHQIKLLCQLVPLKGRLNKRQKFSTTECIESIIVNVKEDDPEKQRRWELKEQKRQQKRKTPKMKQLKVKAL